jgi:hypothetical protein
MVSATLTIRPSQFSALKALDPLDDQGQDEEDGNRHPDVKQVLHGYSSWTR